MTYKRRPVLAVVGAVSLAAMLTSCFPGAARPSASASASPPAVGPGISREAAGELLNAVPGLKLGSVGSVISGLSTETVVEVYVDDEASIMAEGVLDYVLRVGWATRVPDKPTSISLTVRYNGTTLNLQDEAIALAGVNQLEEVRPYSAYLFSSDYLGAWPGAVPPQRPAEPA